MKPLCVSIALACMAALAGCAVGPDFERPAAPLHGQYTQKPIAESGGHPLKMEAIVNPRWWTAFGAPRLDAIVDAAFVASPDLAAADAALRAAHETVAAQRSILLPNVEVQITPIRQKIAASLSSPTESGESLYTLHTAQLNVAYSPDVFGGLRRLTEAGVAQADGIAYQRAAARLSLAANLVTAVIGAASLREQIAASRAMVNAAAGQVEAMRMMRRIGQAGAAELAGQEALQAQALASLPPLERQLAQQANLIAVLCGRTPGEQGLPLPLLDELQMPDALPLSLPAQLVRQRPDILAAEAQLHAAAAQVGIAEAARWPAFALTASLGGVALKPSTLFNSGNEFWSIGANLVQPLFQGGMLRYRKRAAEDYYEQAGAQYRAVVLGAFQNVADALQAIDADSRADHAAAATELAAQRGLSIVRRQWQLGAGTHLAVLQAEQNWQQARAALAPTRSARLVDTVALYQALGGGTIQSD